MSITEGVHELFQSRCAFDLEENFVVVVGDLNVEMLGSWRLLWLSRPRGCVVVGHGDEKFLMENREPVRSLPLDWPRVSSNVSMSKEVVIRLRLQHVRM